MTFAKRYKLIQKNIQKQINNTVYDFDTDIQNLINVKNQRINLNLSSITGDKDRFSTVLHSQSTKVESSMQKLQTLKTSLLENPLISGIKPNKSIFSIEAPYKERR